MVSITIYNDYTLINEKSTENTAYKYGILLIFNNKHIDENVFAFIFLHFNDTLLLKESRK